MGPAPALIASARGRKDRRAEWVQYAAASVLVLLVLQAGPTAPSASSLVAVTGLAVLAVTDATSRRLPAVGVRSLAGFLAAALLGAAWWHGDWGPPLRAVAGAGVVAVLLGALWLALPGAIAFGDVKVTVVAFAAAAAVSWRAGAVMIVVACVIGGIVAVIVRGTRRHLAPVQPTIPFVPGLALGFVVGVMVPW